MNGKKMLVDLIRSTNQAVLDSYGVTLEERYIDFTDPVAGSFIDGTNTVIVGTATGGKIVGRQTYYYNRADAQRIFQDLGVTEVGLNFDFVPTGTQILDALRNLYGLDINPYDIGDIRIDGDKAYITFSLRSIIWIGVLTVNLSGDVVQLAVAFPDNVLDGLTTA